MLAARKDIEGTAPSEHNTLNLLVASTRTQLKLCTQLKAPQANKRV